MKAWMASSPPRKPKMTWMIFNQVLCAVLGTCAIVGTLSYCIYEITK